MPLECHTSIDGGHTLPVVCHLHRLTSCAYNLYLDLRRTGIDGVL